MRLPGRRRSNPVLFGFMGLLTLSAAVGVFLLILGSVYGRFELDDLWPTREKLQAALASPRAAILESRYSEQLMPEGSLWLQDNVDAWERFLKASRWDYDVLNDQSMESEKLEDYALLILPGSRALSDAEIGQIKKYIDQGGSVFATGGTGNFTERGEWRGWEFLSQVFGLEFSLEITPDQAARLHTLRGGLPITAGIPTGYSLKVATWDNPIACAVLEPRTTQASTWYNFKSDLGLARESIERTAGIAYGEYGRGKFVWMGFELNSVLGNQNDYVYFEILARRCIDWLSGVPTVQVQDWPAGYAAAAMFVLPLTEENAHTASLLGSFRKERVPVTAFIDPSGSDSKAGRFRSLLSYGDVGTLLGEESGRTVTSAAQMAPLTGAASFGILPASGKYGEEGLHAFLEAGYQYMVSDSLMDRAVPQTIIKGERSLVAFSKTARSDIEVVQQFGLEDTVLQLFTYREDVDRVLFQGGLYTLWVHQDLQGRPEFVPVLGNLARYLKSRNVWTATGSEIARWWLARSALEVSVRTRSKRRISVVVTNPSAAEIAQVVIQLNINKPASNVALTSDIVGTQIPPSRYNPRTRILEITLPHLKAGASLSLFVDFDLPTV